MRPLRLLSLYKALGIAYLTALIILSLSPSLPPGPQIPQSDKILHWLAYFLLMLGWGQVLERSDWRLWAALGFVALGALLEALQGWGGLRQMESLDALANALGVLAGWLLARGRAGGLLLKAETRFFQRI